MSKEPETNNANQPAFGTPSVYTINGELLEAGDVGLTKREYFAAMAMQGLLANATYFNPNEKHKMIMDEQLCKRAVDFSDELLKQLEHGN